MHSLDDNRLVSVALLTERSRQGDRSPRRQNLFQQGWNREGLVSETGQRKLAFDVLADFYNRKGDSR